MLREQVLARKQHQWDLNPAMFDSFTLPASLQSAIFSRIESLAEKERQALLCAAVLSSFDLGTFLLLQESSEQEALALLDRLVRNQLIWEEAQGRAI